MNILISTLVSSAVQNGLSKYIKYLILGLQELDSNHNFFILTNKEFSSLIQLKNPRFKKILINLPHNPRFIMRPAYFFWQHLMFEKIVRKYKIDLFHSTNPVPLFSNLSIPYVVTIHDVAEYSVERFGRFRSLLRIIANETSAKYAGLILTVSDFSKKEIIQKLSVEPENISVIYHGVTESDESNSGIVTDFSKRSFLIHVGGLRPNKNVMMIINAFKRLNRPELKLYFIGNKDGLNFTKDEIEDLSKYGIYFKGVVSDKELTWYYKHALALIYPSIYEGFGLPILEAMFFGTPVITSNITSMPEVGGDSAHYVDPYSISSIISGIEKVLDDYDYRELLASKGRNRVKDFSWEETARLTLNAYEKLLK